MKTKETIGPVEAIVSKLTTTIDGAYKLTIDVAATEDKETASKLLQLALNPTMVWLTLVKTEK